MQDSSADSWKSSGLKDFQVYIVRTVWSKHPTLTHLDRPFFHCHICPSFTIPLMRGLFTIHEYHDAGFKREVIASSTSILSYFTCGYWHYNSESQWRWTNILLINVWNGIFVLWGGGVGSQRRREKQFYKLVLQLDLLTQYPKTFFLPLNQ